MPNPSENENPVARRIWPYDNPVERAIVDAWVDPSLIWGDRLQVRVLTDYTVPRCHLASYIGDLLISVAQEQVLT
jgi:hypothetical protein